LFLEKVYKEQAMTNKRKKNEYSDLDQTLDIEAFRDSILDFFSEIPDPRRPHSIIFKLEHLFFIIISAILAGANSIRRIALFCEAKSQWLKDLLSSNELPSYGAIWWVLVRVKPEAMQLLLKKWLQGIPEELREQVLAIDGKRLLGTQDNDVKPFLHTVSLFAVNSGIVISQVPVDDKSNEITAIPELLESVDIRGAVVTSDAMGCQKEIAKAICEKGADYVLALKGNAGLIHDELTNFFEQAEQVDYDGVEHKEFFEEDRGHGRFVIRATRCVQELEWLPQKAEWKNLKQVIEVSSKRTVKGKTSLEKRYYITSLGVSAEKLARIIRAHWGIENNLHWHLDVNFLEDKCHANTGYAAENLAIFRKMALNILGSGKGLAERRAKAAWDEKYLTEIVLKFFIKSF
jgi:predicted transposase YbfD/YdcC